MSAFLCTQTHISCVVNAINVRVDLHMSGGELFTLLANGNAASVDCRYDEMTSSLEVSGYRYDPMAKVSAVEALKAVHCLRYQSCEVPDYTNTPAGQALDKIESGIIRRLPGYEQAAWGIEDRAHSGAISLFDLAKQPRKGGR
jgi:hypothetical protein